LQKTNKPNKIKSDYFGDRWRSPVCDRRNQEMLIDRTIKEIPIDALPDEQVMALCNLQN
jgi:hypothetical protein